MRRKANLNNRIKRCAQLLITEPEDFRERWLSEFGFDELYIELGCGKGLFTVEAAKSKPDILFVALEKLDNVLVIALERAEKNELQNVRYINRLADDLTSFFAVGEVSRIYINFCDPWPANRHKKRRLTGHRFLEKYKQVLHPKGNVHFKTDDLSLFEFSKNAFEECGFTVSEVSFDLYEHEPVGIMSDYEMKFHEQGVPIYKLVATVI